MKYNYMQELLNKYGRKSEKKMDNPSLLERSIARIKRGVSLASEKPEENKEAIEELKFILEVLEFLYYRNIEDKVLEEEGVAPFCPCCGSGEYLHNEDENRNEYCGQCGIKLDWSDIEDNYDSINYGFVPKVKITEEDKKIGNVTFKKGVHIYFCGHCNDGILPSWKHCAHCGEKIVWKDKRNLK